MTRSCSCGLVYTRQAKRLDALKREWYQSQQQPATNRLYYILNPSYVSVYLEKYLVYIAHLSLYIYICIYAFHIIDHIVSYHIISCHTISYVACVYHRRKAGSSPEPPGTSILALWIQMGRGWGVEELITFGLHCLMSAVATLKMLLCRVAAKLKMLFQP